MSAQRARHPDTLTAEDILPGEGLEGPQEKGLILREVDPSKSPHASVYV